MTSLKKSVLDSKLENFLYKEQKIVDEFLAGFFGYYLIHFNKYNCLDTSVSKISNQIIKVLSDNFFRYTLIAHYSIEILHFPTFLV